MKNVRLVGLMAVFCTLIFLAFSCGSASKSVEQTLSDWAAKDTEVSKGNFDLAIPAGQISAEGLDEDEKLEVNLTDADKDSFVSDLEDAGITPDLGEDNEIGDVAKISIGTKEQGDKGATVDIGSKGLELAIPADALDDYEGISQAKFFTFKDAEDGSTTVTVWYYTVLVFMYAYSPNGAFSVSVLSSSNFSYSLKLKAGVTAATGSYAGYAFNTKIFNLNNVYCNSYFTGVSMFFQTSFTIPGLVSGSGSGTVKTGASSY